MGFPESYSGVALNLEKSLVCWGTRPTPAQNKYLREKGDYLRTASTSEGNYPDRRVRMSGAENRHGWSDGEEAKESWVDGPMQGDNRAKRPWVDHVVKCQGAVRPVSGCVSDSGTAHRVRVPVRNGWVDPQARRRRGGGKQV